MFWLVVSFNLLMQTQIKISIKDQVNIFFLKNYFLRL